MARLVWQAYSRSERVDGAVTEGNGVMPGSTHFCAWCCRYSFVLQSLVGCVYTFGFVLMCPQLYLNYKLKSVAHLPWRQMTYKFLNTIIDDLFAFVIKMPLLHRLSVFRDDLVFLIYLYQRWVYRVDKSRVNEFGFSDQAPEEEEQAAVTGTPASDGATGTSTAVAADGAKHRKGKGKGVRVHPCMPRMLHTLHSLCILCWLWLLHLVQ
jgi:hypothetical protein